MGGARGQELEDLRHLDNGGGGDDTEAQGLGYSELEALLVREVDVNEQRLVALAADEGEAQVPDGRREVVGDGLEGRAEGVHVGGVGDGRVGC